MVPPGHILWMPRATRDISLTTPLFTAGVIILAKSVRLRLKKSPSADEEHTFAQTAKKCPQSNLTPESNWPIIMSMVEGKLAIRALGDIEVENNRCKILDSKIAKQGSDFTGYGTFSMVDTLYKRRLSYQMWAEKLLEYDPRETSLRAEGGQIVVADLANGYLKSILPESIRVVSEGSGIGTVRREGYVLVNGEFWFENDRKAVSGSDLEEILIAAERGRKPPYFSSKTFVKVDQALIGQTLWVGIFAKELDRNPWDREAVVVDPVERIMVAREVVRPLDKANWDA